MCSVLTLASRRTYGGNKWRGSWSSNLPFVNGEGTQPAFLRHRLPLTGAYHGVWSTQAALQSSEAVWKWRWTSWAPVPNKPTVSVDVKQHFNQAIIQSSGAVWKWRWTSWDLFHNKPTVSVDVKQHFSNISWSGGLGIVSLSLVCPPICSLDLFAVSVPLKSSDIFLGRLPISLVLLLFFFFFLLFLPPPPPPLLLRHGYHVTVRINLGHSILLSLIIMSASSLRTLSLIRTAPFPSLTMSEYVHNVRFILSSTVQWTQWQFPPVHVTFLSFLLRFLCS